MEKFGLLGEHLGHSFSPQIHHKLGCPNYSLVELAPDELGTFFESGCRGLQGFNVTIPYKKAVLPYLAGLSDRAKACGSVNTICKRSDGSLWGENTDCLGFLYMLNKSGLQVKDRKVLILGSGGAAVAVRYVLEQQGANYVVISRSGPENYDNLHRHRDAVVLVNTTPLGMYPNNGVSPVMLEEFPVLEGVLDLIYNPAQTKFMLDAKARGLVAVGGLSMLVAQAKAASDLFLHFERSDDLIGQITEQLNKEMRSIILIGMPGCGKTTTGQILAQRLGRKFFDCDELFTSVYNKSPAQVIETEGEQVFRKMETEILSQVSKESGAVIATGGGVVTRPENLPLLRQNSTVVFLRRALEELSVSGRPLSQEKGVSALAAARLPLYEAWSDYTVSCAGPLKTAQTIEEVLRL
jgi:shikimate dehydrogenase